MAREKTIKRKDKQGLVPPVRKDICPPDENGDPTCDFYYDKVNSNAPDDDPWLAQFCKKCKHLVFIDKRKLT